MFLGWSEFLRQLFSIYFSLVQIYEWMMRFCPVLPYSVLIASTFKQDWFFGFFSLFWDFKKYINNSSPTWASKKPKTRSRVLKKSPKRLKLRKKPKLSCRRLKKAQRLSSFFLGTFNFLKWIEIAIWLVFKTTKSKVLNFWDHGCNGIRPWSCRAS